MKSEFYALRCALFDDSPNRIKNLLQVSNLYAYYKDDDAPEELDKTANELRGLCLKIELLQDTVTYPRIPTDFRLDISNLRELSENLTFSPVINMPQQVLSPDYLKILNDIELIIRNLDVVRLQNYIKKKAVSAGDIVLKE